MVRVRVRAGARECTTFCGEHLCLRWFGSLCRGVASNEAEEAVASSLFCVRTRARIGDVL